MKLCSTFIADVVLLPLSAAGISVVLQELHALLGSVSLLMDCKFQDSQKQHKLR